MSTRNLTLDPVDVDLLLTGASALAGELRGARIFVTGGTGFFGKWLLEALIVLNRSHNLGLSISVLTRDPLRFRGAVPHLGSSAEVVLVPGDLCGLEPPKAQYDYALHVATETRPDFSAVPPSHLFESNLEGTRRFLHVVKACGVRKFLFTSSGAVYGPQPPELTHVPESATIGPDPTNAGSAYGESKRASEFLCAMAGKGTDAAEGKIARCFAFVGPHLPLDANYAIGNFIRDALSGGSIRIGGDGTPRRSYLYAADLAIWLLHILLRGRAGEAYNVGSSAHCSIRELAEAVARVVAPKCTIEVARTPIPGSLPSRYVPSVDKAANDLGLKSTVDLDEAIRRTAAWHSSLRKPPVQFPV
jgi:nucleoside-diphosphate-sugar epimerase